VHGPAETAADHPIRRLAALGLLGLATIVPVAGCGPERLSSLPVQAPARQVTATPSAAASASSSRAPVAPPQPPPAPPPVRPPPPDPPVAPTPTGPSCPDPVPSDDVDLTDSESDLPEWMCFQTGGVLRLNGIGAGAATAEPSDLVDPSWEADVQRYTFRAPGVVTVGFPRGEGTHTITVVVNA
jgi:hypothetical protein